VWITEFEQLLSPIGISFWGSSILIGILHYFLLIKLHSKDIAVRLNQRVVIISTGMTIGLSIVALIIEFTVFSMPRTGKI
jgi:hypothetical protein